MSRIAVFTPRVNLGEAIVVPRLPELEERMPKGWLSDRRRSSVTFRPKNRTLPSIKLHYTPLRIDYDYKEGRAIKTKRLSCKSVDDALSQVHQQFAALT